MSVSLPLIYGTGGKKYWCKQVEVICCVSPLDYGMYKSSVLRVSGWCRKVLCT